MAAAQTAKPTVAQVRSALERQPLVGVSAASKLLGIPPPNFRRDAADHLTAVPVEGSANVYFRSEVAHLAKQFAAKRRARSNGTT